ncbi:efflux RND transporter permease subunit [Clostridium sp. 'deep sea']|uniref:efflux RND transporter permease subunit n=1 Tax=Clostridium sp. 'deep sea' TaxID=2779445 RepID=UPI00189681DB|nr:efflux RND transporter permease subunit [Clostridium sp. 'deep sea']QOR34030.1 efflux RND transporter permease subunit [Clostridium sp. 'deep sea']
MSKLLKNVIKYRKISLFLVGIIALAGMYSYYMLPRNEMPDVPAPVAVITAVYPGATPADIDRLVVDKIEKELVELEGYDYAQSYIYNSYAFILLRMDFGIDTTKTWDELRRKMEDVQKELPTECQTIDIDTDIMETAGMILALTGENYSYEELNTYAEDLSRQLSKIKGMTRFEIEGKQDKEVIIDIDYKLLNQYNLSLNDILNLIRGQNIEIPSGTITDGSSTLNVKTDGTFSSLEDIKAIVVGISTNNGTVLRLSDIADISLKISDDMYRVKHNGQNAILLTGFFQKGTNIVLTGKNVETVVSDFISNLPEGVTVDKVLDQPYDVKKSVNNFAMSLLQGILFVIAVVFFGMGLRNAIIVSTAIPLSILVTFGVMIMTGVELHTISIASLIIALGMLVDNAIVVSDAIQNRLDDGEEKLNACVNGVKEVAIPVLTSTLTTIAAFSPFLLMDSIAGEFMITLPKIIITSLTASYIIALFVTPTMAYIFFKPSEQKHDKSKIVRGFFDKLLARAMKNKKMTVVLAFVMIIGAGILVMQLHLQFFPFADKDLMFIDIEAERNINIETTKQVTDQIEEIIKDQKEILQYTTSLGGGLPKFYTTVFNYKKSASTAQILMKVDLSEGEFDDYSQLLEELQRKIDEKVMGGKATVRRLELAEYIGNPVQVRLTGDNLAQLESAAEIVKQQLYSIPGVTNVNDNFPDRMYEYNVNVDNDKAAYMGLTKYDIQNEVSIALRGRIASTLRYRGEDFNIKIKSNNNFPDRMYEYNVNVDNTNKKTLLKNVAEPQPLATIPGLYRYDRDYAIVVASDLLNGYEAKDIVKVLNDKLNEVNLLGVQVSYDGEQAKIKENFGDMGKQGVFAVLMVYLILLFQFRSFRQPFIILLTIPLSAIGSICGLYLTRHPLSFTALMGMISLMGIVVNNAIVLIDYINRARSEGEPIQQACLKATNKRFRPIILSTTTTFIGMIPLLFSGSDLFGPMSISLMFGLLVSTVLTLVVVPVVYSMLEKRLKKILKKQKRV